MDYCQLRGIRAPLGASWYSAISKPDRTGYHRRLHYFRVRLFNCILHDLFCAALTTLLVTALLLQNWQASQQPLLTVIIRLTPELVAECERVISKTFPACVTFHKPSFVQQLKNATLESTLVYGLLTCASR